jgi:hypothetical protein
MSSSLLYPSCYPATQPAAPAGILLKSRIMEFLLPFVSLPGLKYVKVCLCETFPAALPAS